RGRPPTRPPSSRHASIASATTSTTTVRTRRSARCHLPAAIAARPGPIPPRSKTPGTMPSTPSAACAAMARSDGAATCSSSAKRSLANPSVSPRPKPATGSSASPTSSSASSIASPKNFAALWRAGRPAIKRPQNKPRKLSGMYPVYSVRHVSGCTRPTPLPNPSPSPLEGEGGEGGARSLEPPTRWLVVWALILAGVVAAFQIGKVPVALPVLRAELGLGLVGAGWVVSMFNVLGALVGALVGAAGDQIGHRRAVLAGLMLSGAASAIGAAAPDAAVLLATRFLEGLGFMATVTAAPALIARMARRADQRLAFGFWSGYMPAGSALMMLASPPLLAASGWRGLWLVNAALMLAAALLTAVVTRDLSRAETKTAHGLA